MDEKNPTDALAQDNQPQVEVVTFGMALPLNPERRVVAVVNAMVELAMQLQLDLSAFANEMISAGLQGHVMLDGDLAAMERAGREVLANVLATGPDMLERRQIIREAQLNSMVDADPTKAN